MARSSRTRSPRDAVVSYTAGGGQRHTSAQVPRHRASPRAGGRKKKKLASTQTITTRMRHVSSLFQAVSIGTSSTPPPPSPPPRRTATLSWVKVGTVRGVSSWAVAAGRGGGGGVQGHLTRARARRVRVWRSLPMMRTSFGSSKPSFCFCVVPGCVGSAGCASSWARPCFVPPHASSLRGARELGRALSRAGSKASRLHCTPG